MYNDIRDVALICQMFMHRVVHAFEVKMDCSVIINATWRCVSPAGLEGDVDR